MSRQPKLMSWEMGIFFVPEIFCFSCSRPQIAENTFNGTDDEAKARSDENNSS